MYAREGDGREALFELKHLAECLMEGCEVRLASARPFEHPERAAIIAWRGEDIGRLFELHPSLGIKGRAAILDLDLDQDGKARRSRAALPAPAALPGQRIRRVRSGGLARASRKYRAAVDLSGRQAIWSKSNSSANTSGIRFRRNGRA